MLGLRRVNGCQIDLHQGEIGRFACDSPVAAKSAADVVRGLAVARRVSARHVAVDAPSTVATESMVALRAFVLSDHGAVRRVTFVAPTADGYAAWQAAIQATFPEDD